jgi:phosphoglycerate dehydrogenase-like enzyme
MAPQAIYDDEPQSAVGKPTVYLLDKFHPAVEEYCRDHFNAILPGNPEHGEWRQKARYLLVRSARLTAEDIDACPNLIAVGKQGVGIDKIDAAACAARGIKIFNTPGVNARAVAEIVLSLTMAVVRQVGSIVARQTAGALVPKETCSGLILHRKTIGILGMGNIGKIVAQMFKGAFDAEIIAFDPYVPPEAWSDLSHTRAKTIEEVLVASDVVTLHMPLTETTRGLISYPQLQIMKKNAVLINAARGGIVNEADLERALEEGLIWGAGLDCHEQEPPSKEKYGKLWDLGVISTPHVGAATAQTQMETGLAAATRLFQYSQLKDKRNL